MVFHLKFLWKVSRHCISRKTWSFLDNHLLLLRNSLTHTTRLCYSTFITLFSHKSTTSRVFKCHVCDVFFWFHSETCQEKKTTKRATTRHEDKVPREAIATFAGRWVLLTEIPGSTDWLPNQHDPCVWDSSNSKGKRKLDYLFIGRVPSREGSEREVVTFDRS